MAFLAHIPPDIQALYEIHDFAHAAAILAHEFPDEFRDVCEVLRGFRLSRADIVAAGGSESAIPKRIDGLLAPRGWTKRPLRVEMAVDGGNPVATDTHIIDHVKGRIAFDVEWNSKDQTFDRDLFAFSQFFSYRQISAGVLLTRSADLNPLFNELGLMHKYGASTTWMGKLLPRLRAGRQGGCPVLAIGITGKLVTG